MATSRRTAKVFEMVEELSDVLQSLDNVVLIDLPQLCTDVVPYAIYVEYNGHSMRIIVEDCDP